MKKNDLLYLNNENICFKLNDIVVYPHISVNSLAIHIIVDKSIKHLGQRSTEKNRNFFTL